MYLLASDDKLLLKSEAKIGIIPPQRNMYDVNFLENEVSLYRRTEQNVSVTPPKTILRQLYVELRG